MRASAFIGQCAAFVVMVVLLWGAGRWIVERDLQSTSVMIEEPDDDMGALFDEDGNLLSPEEAAVPQPPAEDAPTPPPDAPATEESELERLPPREPLGQIGQALPPPPGEWKATILYKPVAVAAGRIESMGYEVAVAGVDVVAANETCSYEGKNWDCGLRARTAFRSLLRGRSPTCTVPGQPAGEPIAADCHLGNEDLGAWLVGNGWARAIPGGPYAEAGARAQQEHRGIFGSPPDTSLPAAPQRIPSLLEEPAPQSLETDETSGQEAGSVTILPGEFPPAPSPPTVQPEPLQ